MAANNSGLAESIIDTIEDLTVFAGSIFGAHANDYCDIETSDDSHTLVTKSGALLSAIDVRGINYLVGPEEFEELVASLNRAISPLMNSPGHVMQFWFQRDPDSTKEAVAEAVLPSRATAKRLHLDVEDVLDSKVDHLAKYCSDERFIIGLWTTSEVLTKQAQSRAAKLKGKDMSKTPGFIRPGTQNIVAGMPDLRELHRSAFAGLLSELSETGFFAVALSSHEMLREVRAAIAPEVTPFNWRPSLPGDKIPRFQRGTKKGDLSEIGYPPVSWQIFPHDMERRPNGLHLESGNRVYAPVFVEIPPTEILPFSKLFNSLSGAKIPWRISFTIEGGGVKSMSFKAAMSSFLSWAHSYNRQIDEVHQALKNAEMEGSACVRMRIALCTWAPKSQPGLIEDRVARLSKALTAWGRAEMREASGDAMLGFISSCPLLSLKSAANPCVAPVEELVRMLPVDRLSSAWQSGGVIFRTLDGRIIPFEPGSSRQTTWNYLFFARPGMGKSVLMAAINLASCIRAGQEKLPYVSYIDIGPSSKGFVDLVRDALPPHMKHLTAHFKIRMTKDYAINPFDTQLGLRFPLPDEQSFLRGFLTLLATPAENKNPYDSMSALCSKVIDEAYKTFSDGPKGKPKMYTPGVCPEVDEELELHRFHAEKGTPWWEVVDFLFERGNEHLAALAQRYASPTLEDVASVANMPAIADLYGRVIIDTGEPLNAAFSRIIADKIRDFPILSCETRFDVGQARVLAIDLDEVAKSGEVNAHQNAVLYMLARFVAARNFRLHKEILKEVPSLYQMHYQNKIEEVHSSMKWIIYDEFHRTASSPAVRDQVLVDMREGRKWNLGVMLASQSVEDFDETMKEFASATFILNAGTNTAADKLQGLFGFNDTSKNMLLTHANGPTSKGAPFLVQFATKKGASSQFLVSSISPVEAWAFSTTAEDVLIREALYARIGPQEARRLLARAFPGGSAKEEVERLRGLMTSTDEDGEQGKSAINKVVEQLLEQKHREDIEKAA